MTTTYSVTTDLNDYPPGATALITASGFQAGSAVIFRVQHVGGPGADGIYGTLDDEVVDLGGAGHDPWTVVDGGVGMPMDWQTALFRPHGMSIRMTPSTRDSC